MGTIRAPELLGDLGELNVCRMKVRDLIKLIETDEWQQVAQRGSHRQYKHRVKPGKVTVSGAPSDDVHPKTLSSVLRQAGLKKQ